jgi:hypothetical protein
VKSQGEPKLVDHYNAAKSKLLSEGTTTI